LALPYEEEIRFPPTRRIAFSRQMDPWGKLNS